MVFVRRIKEDSHTIIFFSINYRHGRKNFELTLDHLNIYLLKNPCAIPVNPLTILFVERFGAELNAVSRTLFVMLFRYLSTFLQRESCQRKLIQKC
jgi:hypothetical protein